MATSALTRSMSTSALALDGSEEGFRLGLRSAQLAAVDRKVDAGSDHGAMLALVPHRAVGAHDFEVGAKGTLGELDLEPTSFQRRGDALVSRVSSRWPPPRGSALQPFAPRGAPTPWVVEEAIHSGCDAEEY